MIVLVFLVTFLDALLLPVTGLLPQIVFIVMIGLGLWGVGNFKSWYMLAVTYMVVALAFYLLGNTQIDEMTVHKLADWAYVFLILGTIGLVRFYRSGRESPSR